MAKNFDRLRVDDNRRTIQAANAFLTADISSTPKTSPLTVSTSEVVISVPTNAYSIVIYPKTGDLRVSEVTGMAQYTVLLNAIETTIDVASMDTIYLKRDGASDSVVNFRFLTI